MGSKRDNIAAATAAGLLHSAPHSPQPTGIPERRSRPQSKRHSMGGLPTGDDSEEELEHADDAAPPLVPTKYVEELSEGMTVYDLFSTPVPPPSEPPVTGVASPEDVLSRPPMPSNWEYRTISAAPSPRILTYDLSAAPSSSRSSGKRSRAVPEQQGEDKKLMLSNPDMGLGLGIRSAVATEEPIAAGTPVTEKSGWKSSGTEQRTGTDGAGSVGPADL